MNVNGPNRNKMWALLVLSALCFAPLALARTVDVTAAPFNAKGDGQSDDHAAIQAAVDSLANTGGEVLLPAPGQYAVSAAIVMSNLNSVTLRGGGAHPGSCTTRGSSLLALGSNSTLVIVERSGHIIITDLLLAHARSNSSSSTSSASPQLPPNAGAYHNRHPRRLKRSSSSSYRHQNQHSTTTAAAAITPTSGCAIIVRDFSYDATLQRLWFEGVFGAVSQIANANTLTLTDINVLEIYGPNAVYFGGGKPGARVDVMQITRFTANQPGSWATSFQGNESVVWLDMDGGANTLRLDNVGLINGGTGLRMHGDAQGPPGVAPGRPLFVFANDLEIDFPQGNAIQLDVGESALFSNAYIQGSQTANGVFASAAYDSEIQLTNSRIFGHHLAGIELAGGHHALLSNNIIGDNSIAGANVSSAVLVRSGVSDFIVSSNHIGAVFGGETSAKHRFGVEIEAGASDRFVVQGNTATENLAGGISDGATGTNKVVANNVVWANNVVV